MVNSDLLQRFIFVDAPVRGEFIHLHNTYQTIISQHTYPAPLKQLLGEALCVAGLLSAVIKFTGRLTVQFRGKGKLKLLLAQCDHHFNMRALAKWDGELSHADLMDAFNQGVLVIMLDSGPKSHYQGIVSWRGHSLADSIEGYFRESEQLVTKIWLAVNETSASGFLLQVVPETDKAFVGIEKEIVDSHWARIIAMTAQHRTDNMLRQNTEGLLRELYPTEDIRVFTSVPVAFRCTCSRKRGEDAILLLGQQEAEAELKEKQHILVTCDFCNRKYNFDPIDVAKIFANKDQFPSDTHLH